MSEAFSKLAGGFRVDVGNSVVSVIQRVSPDNTFGLPPCDASINIVHPNSQPTFLFSFWGAGVRVMSLFTRAMPASLLS